MKKTIITVLIFTTLLFSLDSVLGSFLTFINKDIKNGEIGNLNYILNDSEDDIVVIGASSAAHHYDTSILRDSLNMEVVNAGMDGQSIFYHYTILSSMILSGRIPSLVIYDINEYDMFEYDNPNLLSLDAALSLLRPYYRIYPQVDSLVKYKGFTEHIKMESKLYRFNSRILPIFKSMISKSGNDGYVPLIRNGAVIEHDDKAHKKKNNLDSLKYNTVKKLILLSKKYNFELVVVKSPRLFKDKNSFNTYIEGILQKYNIDFIDMSELGEFRNVEYFYDKNHLNYEGSQVFSRKISSFLKKKLNQIYSINT